ncbi:unnamed protein product [Clonostachys rosea]|uniref:Ribonuclease H n=1 Tax=Bionectria ochroleuca TaxID=29856 RepID=A0ABY6UUS9_BIOOC|nr:unnamed protein product [Clonostachys rosea]
MTNVRRAVPSAGRSAPASSSSKKRKQQGPRYYAVQEGRRPGVYETYPECEKQTTGRGALTLDNQTKLADFALLVKSFTSRQDAEAFAAGKKVQASPDEPQKFYAVAVGTPAGIYNDWSEASKAIVGVKGPKYKKFNTREEAVAYIRLNGSAETVRALGLGETVSEKKVLDVEEDSDDGEDDIEESRPTKKLKTTTKENADGFMQIYTDGSSRSNGRAGARAGIGVFFGDGDHRNISEPLPGEPQTNQRAELMAMFRALEVVADEQNVRIISDSKYSINCVTDWAAKWEKGGWKTSNGDTVKNQDIISAVRKRLAERSQAGAQTDFRWVKGHASDPGNVAADLLAVNGAKQR